MHGLVSTFKLDSLFFFFFAQRVLPLQLPAQRTHQTRLSGALSPRFRGAARGVGRASRKRRVLRNVSATSRRVCVTSPVKWPRVKSEGPHTRTLVARVRSRKTSRGHTRVSLSGSFHVSRLARRGRSIIILSITVRTTRRQDSRRRAARTPLSADLI